MIRRGGSPSIRASDMDLEGSFDQSSQWSSNPSFRDTSGNISWLRWTKYAQPIIIGSAVMGLLTLILADEWKYSLIVCCICCGGLAFGGWLCGWLMGKPAGNDEMRGVSEPIRLGAEGFLHVQYGAIARLAGVAATFIFLSYKLRTSDPSVGGIQSVSTTTLGIIGSISFLMGAVCSAAAGYISMWVSARSNIRVAASASRSYREALTICFRGGAFSAIVVISMCVLGVTMLHMLLHVMFALPVREPGYVSSGEVPMLLAGYGFGASFVALFMQLGGGVYTKAADVGADLVGKIDEGIPEDDPRNPAVIADLVGDMVGDCVGSSADIFESVAAEIIGAMILGGSLASEAGLTSVMPFVYFPVMVHAFDIMVSSVGIMMVGRGSETDPLPMLMRGYTVSLILGLLGFCVSTRWLLYTPEYPTAWIHYLFCGLVGMITAYVFVRSTQYYTDYAYPPVRSIAQASTTGHGTNIIAGVAVGMKSTVVPVMAVAIAVVVCYWLGRTSGLGAGHNAGLFGTAVATMGMLSSAGFVLSMNNYGPIADNAGGIAEMSRQPSAVRDITDRLDATGNVTKAMTKGYSIGSAALACFLLFGAVLDEFTAFSGRAFHSVDLARVEVLAGGLLGVMMVFFFVGLSVAAVGNTAQKVVEEVRRQLNANREEIMAYRALPDYKACVALVTSAALREMTFPGLLAVGMPITVGVVFRLVGDASDRPLLGAEVLTSFIMFATVAGILMALFLDNVGGAWDNAKKFVELGNHGGKGSEAHKAAVTGDTVGDPFKDTAGPSLHVVIKLLSTTVLVLAPLFVSRAI